MVSKQWTDGSSALSQCIIVAESDSPPFCSDPLVITLGVPLSGQMATMYYCSRI